MSLWKRLFGKNESDDSKPRDSETPRIPPRPRVAPAAGGSPVRPPAGAAKPKPAAPAKSKSVQAAASAAIAAPWKARPIFISSTFKDMQAERDYLRSHVFPRLEEELRKRRHQLEPIDLRLGVETAQLGTDEARELLVLKVCLDEIQRSRPFMLVLLGDRYGWVPPPDRMAIAAQEAGFKADLQDKSVTALEIEFGVLKQHPDQRRRSFFYFRQPLPYADMPPEVAAQYSDAQATDPRVRAGHDRLEALKQSLRNDPELAPHVHDYATGWDSATGQVTDLEAWGEMVFQHLWKELDEETRAFAAQPPPTEEAQERAALVEYAEHRSRDFTGRKDLLQQLHALATAPAENGADWGACVTGVPGSGKSAVFGELFRRLTDEKSALILANAAGGTPRGSQVDFMLRRFIQELVDFLQEENPLPEKAGPDDVDAAFAALLTRAAAQTRVVVLLDALDQFDPTPRGQHLTWLRAKQWPANARLIATALPGTGAEALAKFVGVKNLDMPPLGTDDIAEIAKRVWARYHRQVNPDVVSILTKKKQPDGTPVAANPLWLTLALEQLNLLDADDFARAEREFTGSPAERLRALMLDTARRLPPTVSELYGWLLEQTEKAYGAPQARAFAALIAVSRFGWRESDLQPLVPRVAAILFPDSSSLDAAAFDDLHLAVLRRGFRAHLGRRGVAGQIDFLHAQMRQAVRKRALGDAETEKYIHRTLADHLEQLTLDDPLRATELMVHLIEGDDAPRAARVYADLPDPSAGLTGATQALARYVVVGTVQRPNPNVAWIAALLMQPGIAGQQLSKLVYRFNFALNDALENATDLPTRQTLLMAARQSVQHLVASDPTNAGWQRDLSESQSRIGDVLLAQGDLGGALKAYRETHTILQRLSQSDPTNGGWQQNLSANQGRIGEVLRSQGDLGGALKACRESLAMAERLAQSDPLNAEWQRGLSYGQMGIGVVLRVQGDLGGALKAYRESLAVRERLAQSEPSNAVWQSDLSESQSRIGDVLLAQGDLGGALKACRESLAVRKRLAQSDPTNRGWQRNLSVSQGRVGDVLLAQGDLGGALKAYRESHAILWHLTQYDPTNADLQQNLSVSHGRVGDVLLAQGDLGGALKACQESLAVAERLAQSDPLNAEFQRNLSVSQGRVGDVLLAQGDLSGALKACRETCAIFHRLAQSDPTNAGWQRDLSVSWDRIGDVLLGKGDLGGALKAYRESLAVRERLAQSEPSNADWQQNLWVSQANIGDVLLSQGDLGGAQKAYREAMSVHERRAQSEPTNVEWQRDLFVDYGKIAQSLENGNPGEARAWWGKAYNQLSGMKKRGVILPTDEPFLPILKQKAGM